MQKHIFYNLWCATDKTHNIKLEYDKSKKIKDQILFEQGHVKLLNVSKSYCDGKYQGVWFLFLVGNNSIIKYYKNKSAPNLANTITLTSTGYSTITYDFSI